MKDCASLPIASTSELKAPTAQMGPGIINPTTGCDWFAKLTLRAWWLHINIECWRRR
jgi:hypothetical protein